MKSCPTFWAEIYVGLREGYTEKIHTNEEVLAICQEYVNDNPLCVMVFPVDYIYHKGDDPGMVVRLINYPRFPDESRGFSKIKKHARAIAKRLKEELKQNRISIQFPDTTIMI